MRFNFSDSNLIILSSHKLFPDISRQWFVSLPHIDKVEQIHTHKGPSDKSLFPPEAPSVKSTHPFTPIVYQKDATENVSSVITVVIFTYNCVFCFSILMSVRSQKCSLAWHTSKHGVAHNPMLYSWHLYFVLVSLFSAEHKRHWNLLHCISQYLLCLESSLFSLLMDGACLLCFVVWDQGTLPSSCIRTLTNESELPVWQF
jgi:hypothetical protein